MLSLLAALLFSLALGLKLHLPQWFIISYLVVIALVEQWAPGSALLVLIGLFVCSPVLIHQKGRWIPLWVYGLCVIIPAAFIKLYV
ncbi:hypothetical protein H4F18_04510 [Vibrio scophthalmi]|uniref:hypothetical protein n=1 Tax=Vibrio scophthalmi TaxID=45658 RepID=UPI002FF3F452